MVALALAVAAGAHAQAGRPARLYVLADSVSPGQRVAVAVAVDHAPGAQTLFPDAPVALPETGPGLAFGDAEVLTRRRLPPRARGSVRTDSAVYETAVFAVDSARVGPVAVRLVAGGDTTRLTTGVAVLPVRRLAGADDALPPPGPPLPFPSPVPHLTALGVLGLGLAAALALRWRRRRRQRPAPGAPTLAPYPEALARLDALDAGRPDTPAAVEAQVDALKEALRRYLTRRLGVPADRLTTNELDAGLAPVLPDDARRQVRGVLRLADLVDFAALRPGADATADARRQTRAAVEAVEAAVRAAETPASP